MAKNKIIRVFLRTALVIAVAGVLALALPRLLTQWMSASQIYQTGSAPEKPVAIVFGAGLTRDGRPGGVLRDRVRAAAELYFQGKVQKLLMSGDNRFVDYNEPGAMHEYAVELGVPSEAIVLDYAGRRTYDTCYRARQIFGVKEALLVTQNFHLPRALFLCNSLGVDSVGVSADLGQYRRRSLIFWNIREIPATAAAMLDVFITHPEPDIGQPEPIFTELEAQ